MTKEEFPDEIKENATTIYEILGKEILKNDLIGNILDQMNIYYDMATEHGFDDIIQEWEKRCTSINKRVKILLEDTYVEGRVLKVNKNGFLILRKEDGNIEEIRSGSIIEENLI